MIETIPGPLAGERLDRVVALLTGRSRAEAAALVDRGAVRVAGTPVTKPATRLAEGDVIEVALDALPDARVVAADPSVTVTVVHEDADVIVVDKPPGLVVHPGAGNQRHTLVHGLLARYPELSSVGAPDRPGIVHRLDKDTSGLLAVARTAAAYDSLVGQLAARSVDRAYLALVWGTVESPHGMVDAPVGRSNRTPTRMAVSAGGREARTRYEVVTRFTEPAPATFVQCKLETGRTHQIRVHFAAIGHPVVGDRRYDGERPHIVRVPRFFLHAAHLAFDHPVDGGRLAFDVPLPADLEEVRDRFS